MMRQPVPLRVPGIGAQSVAQPLTQWGISGTRPDSAHLLLSTLPLFDIDFRALNSNSYGSADPGKYNEQPVSAGTGWQHWRGSPESWGTIRLSDRVSVSCLRPWLPTVLLLPIIAAFLVIELPHPHIPARALFSDLARDIRDTLWSMRTSEGQSFDFPIAHMTWVDGFRYKPRAACGLTGTDALATS